MKFWDRLKLKFSSEPMLILASPISQFKFIPENNTTVICPLCQVELSIAPSTVAIAKKYKRTIIACPPCLVELSVHYNPKQEDVTLTKNPELENFVEEKNQLIQFGAEKLDEMVRSIQDEFNSRRQEELQRIKDDDSD